MLPLITFLININPDGTQIEINGVQKDFNAHIIAPNTSFKVNSAGKEETQGISLLIDTCSVYGQFLLNFLSSNSDKLLENYNKTRLLDFWILLDNGSISPEEFITHIFKIIFDVNSSTLNNSIDERILKVLDHINENYYKNLSNSELANIANLSTGRFEHFFKEEMHIKVREYIKMVRIKKTFALYMRGAKLTKSLLDNGWFDPAHFTNAFKKYFGDPARHFWKKD